MMVKEVESYKQNLKLSEVEDTTIKQYTNYIKQFETWANVKSIKDITKEKLIAYKDYMKAQYKASTVNIKITVLNSFIRFLNLDNTDTLDYLKVQQKSTIENVLSQKDYERLLRIAERKGKIRTKYIMKVLAETGIRISELQYITLEAVKKGIAVFDSKGTVDRKAYINKKLRKELLNYCKEKNISSGIIFASKSGNPLDKSYIYKEIQWVAGQARVNKKKAHPHSFRHLFAKNYLAVPGHNLVDLKNLLSHKSISTTELYLQKSEKELRDTLEASVEFKAV